MYFLLGTRTDAVSGPVGLNVGNVRIWYEEVA